MKKNIALLISVISFVLLFYKHEPGCNLSIFGILVWLLLYFQLDKKHKTKHFWMVSTGLFISLASFAWYGDFASFAPLLLSFLLTGIFAMFPKMNIVITPVLGMINYATSPLRILLVNKWLKPGKLYNNFAQKLIFYCIVPAIFVTAFTAVYAASSKSFAAYFTFNWNIDFAQLIFLTCLGMFLMFNFFHFYIPRFAISANQLLSDNFSKKFLSEAKNNVHLNKLSFQRKSGEITMILLNALLLFFIVVYIKEQTELATANSLSLSEEVHARIYVLIFSIVLAIAVLMIYFRGDFNFDPHARLLKAASYIWLVLNTVLVFITAAKNIEYVQAYGLTFKRIGVFVFLVLCLIGLLITYVKIYDKKTNIFLASRMFWAIYTTLVINATVNWSSIVTTYNFTYIKNTDINYLWSLDYNKQQLADKVGGNYKPYVRNETIKEQVERQTNKPFLSKSFYYQFLNIQ